MSWILACDDHPHITRLVQLTLAKGGWQVTTCDDGETAWEALQGDILPDVIVTDYQMPGLDGLGLCRRIHDEPRLQGIPIILLTAKGFELSEVRLQRDLGVHAVVVKPFSPRQLRSTVQSLVQDRCGT